MDKVAESWSIYASERTKIDQEPGPFVGGKTHFCNPVYTPNSRRK